MITDAPIHASLAVADLARARSWYADKLGWEPTIEADGTVVYQVAESFFTLFETPLAGTARNTVMNWIMPDVEGEVNRLRGRGVVFEEYDFEGFKTVNGIMSEPGGGKNAWFTDSEGNIVGLIQPQTPSSRTLVEATIATADLARAKAWYAEKLGFDPVEVFEGVVMNYLSGESGFSVYQSGFAGTARNTVAVWRLKGIRDEVARLRGRGVVFEDYDFGEDDKTVGGILSDAEGDVNAWFKDPDGNTLALSEDRT
jgi:catechol 2,3-dioxygenase-like lactoylglutathione lyase family enzyme